MKTHFKIASSVLSLVFTFLSSYSNASCTVIDSLPYVINSGNKTYCLNKNFAYYAINNTTLLGHYSIQDPANFWSDFPNINFNAAIVVAASNVTLDLQNHIVTAYVLALPNRVAVGVYANNVSNFKLQNGTIRGFDVGAHIVSTDSALVNHITFDKAKLKAVHSFADQKNTVTNNTVTNFSSVGRWPHAPVSIMNVEGAGGINDIISVGNNTITTALANSVDPTPDDGNPLWGTVGIQITADQGIVNVSNNTLTDITANNGVTAYLYITGPQVTLRNNKLSFPLNNPSSSLQNIGVLQGTNLGGTDTITTVDSNIFSGFYNQFSTFDSGAQLILTNNIFNLYRVNGTFYPPPFNHYNGSINVSGNTIALH